VATSEQFNKTFIELVIVVD
nr:RecName: Full=Coagulation factor X-activating enzyme heavy chain; AltName: Full=Coagulation factor X-activating enzyme chain alpha; AltName: Full=RVV-X heavy chain; AltName: Full=Snake venom metalloproteinase; Short=SVMP [Daboia russelii]